MRVDTPRFGFVKRDERGRVDFVSPLPCPFHYGAVPGTRADDGGERDALHLAQTRAAVGDLLEGEAYFVVRFVDGGVSDDKLVLADRPPSAFDLARVRAFFTLYARAKRVLAGLRGTSRDVRFVGLVARGAP